MNNKGAFTIGPVTIPIDDIYLAAGQVWLTGVVPAPAPPLVADHYDVYDQGGQLVYRCGRHFNIPGSPGGLRLTVQLVVADQTATPGQRPVVQA